MRLTDADKLPEHKFTRKSAKSNDYMRGWNDAIDAIVNNAPTADESDMQVVLNKKCMTIVTNEYLIALQGKRLKGKWIPQTDYDGFTYWKCSECGKKNDYEITDFCFRCGADMREADND